MPGPYTVVTLVDEDGDEFPIRLPGVYPNNVGPDAEAALDILKHEPNLKPRGAVRFERIEYSRT